MHLSKLVFSSYWPAKQKPRLLVAEFKSNAADGGTFTRPPVIPHNAEQVVAVVAQDEETWQTGYKKTVFITALKSESSCQTSTSGGFP